MDYVLKQYGERTTIVLDGYYGKPFTKDTTHVRRTKSKKGISVHFTGEIKLNMKTNEFLTNLENKQRFMEMLVIKMNEAKLIAIQSSGDADVLIVQTVVSSAATKPTVIIGEDTDLLILLLHHAKMTAICDLRIAIKRKYQTLGYQVCQIKVREQNV